MRTDGRRPLRAALLAAGGTTEDVGLLGSIVARVAARPRGLRQRFAEAELVVTEAYEVRLPGPAAVVELASWVEEQERSPPREPVRRRSEGRRWRKRRKNRRRERC